MDRMTPEQMIEVIQAYIDGKQIQYSVFMNGSSWVDDDKEQPLFNFGNVAYRVKPEPREFHIRKTTGLGGETWSVTEYPDYWNDAIKVREVIE